MQATVTWSTNLQSVVREMMKSNNANESDLNAKLFSLSNAEQKAVIKRINEPSRAGAVVMGYWY